MGAVQVNGIDENRNRAGRIEMINLNVDGINISAEKKNIKNMYLRVIPPDGKVKITAPLFTSDDKIRMFAVSRIAWIRKQRQKFLEQPRQAERKYETGESYYLWGKRYCLEIIYSNTQNDAYISGQNIVLQVREDSTPHQRAYIMDEWYRRVLKNAIPSVLEKCERIVGVKANEWKVKNMRTRWGTCNIQAKRIWINLQLVKKSSECLEYVIIHELVHLLEKNHNDSFKAYIWMYFVLIGGL